ncbi:MAG: DUF167 family protein [Beijerinckiaceae bacterium]|nr:DUF167 family protein [Beijerinckiaceae bacterium]
MADVPWSLRGNALLLTVRLTPKSSRDEIGSIDILADGRAVLKARVRALPEHGKANEALLRLIAEALDLPAGAVRLEAGASGRVKVLCLSGDARSLAAGLTRLCSPG